MPHSCLLNLPSLYAQALTDLNRSTLIDPATSIKLKSKPQWTLHADFSLRRKDVEPSPDLNHMLGSSRDNLRPSHLYCDAPKLKIHVGTFQYNGQLTLKSFKYFIHINPN